ncbi:type II toxin-antitoxin system RelE/ParE family toxin [Aetokthonos hydrillicola Thurmond2011]|jgi:addiction module RelE/StbE family toxin|uniref:Type II toxin-antitoxin system RelE/ParE family toxin n=1 Tax=Aetokthonos hydrillicola Thurmond2011 TaxID=2712845 RepID=A0AAP5IA36_9CYAN|nr:type II toxin-antitoxin system RelE/ParE family toxin [Aetokthonos hydrillicola]MBO3460523.1 type II toxin-antitoxin system RelE/ParE family toxin [Aetokthonos hydrillicola CCALA 1050]MBW4585350.1 type II toxin-antitoxin system RelE/ParE family toxin [Aetokthonos hydrillicola CCALA 1050]MDR9896514.1 type II toxin-antitoxin system RelE/ParE family toxin [Aetokthonos hydrillicola Thurmond2011]
MAYQVVWSPKALEDLEAIATYISRDSASYAASVVNKILEATRNLGKFPFSGRVVPEFSEDNIREQFAYNYRIIYKVDDDNITVAAVIYGRRLLDKLDTQT